MKTLDDLKNYISTSQDQLFYTSFVEAVKKVNPNLGELEVLSIYLQNRIDSVHKDAIKDGKITWINLESQT